jgi:hypothetical protein
MRITPMPPYANQVVDALIKASNTLDPVMVNEFFAITLEANLAHLELIKGTLSETELLRRHTILCQGSLFLSMFNHFAAKKGGDGLGVDKVRLVEG